LVRCVSREIHVSPDVCRHNSACWNRVVLRSARAKHGASGANRNALPNVGQPHLLGLGGERLDDLVQNAPFVQVERLFS
jgi:hypothetical protein